MKAAKSNREGSDQRIISENASAGSLSVHVSKAEEGEPEAEQMSGRDEQEGKGRFDDDCVR